MIDHSKQKFERRILDLFLKLYGTCNVLFIYILKYISLIKMDLNSYIFVVKNFDSISLRELIKRGCWWLWVIAVSLKLLIILLNRLFWFNSTHVFRRHLTEWLQNSLFFFLRCLQFQGVLEMYRTGDSYPFLMMRKWRLYNMFCLNNIRLTTSSHFQRDDLIMTSK